MKDLVHVKAPGNWINDPNGFIYYKGKYHLFFQHFPYAPEWGTMHWGHTVSEDLVHWEYQGIALFPTKEYDQNGVFSGTALEEDGKLKIYYSAVKYLKPNPEDIHRVLDDAIQTSQAMIVSEDGFHFNNWDKKKVLPTVHDEEVGEPKMRDPKVWKDGDSYYMMMGSSYHDAGRVLFYTSKDGENWTYANQCRPESYGWTIECPDLFSQNDQWIFIGCPMRLTPGEKKYPDQAVWALAEFDPKTCELKLPDTHSYVDYGLDLYAPQTTLDAEGRRVMISWMRMPMAVTDSTDRPAWNGMMSSARVVEEKEGHLYFHMHPQVDAYLSAETTAEEAAESGKVFRIRTDLSEGETLNIGGYVISRSEGKIIGDRSAVLDGCDEVRTVGATPMIEGAAQLDILVNDHLIEIFVNDGQYVLSHVVYGKSKKISGKYEKVLVGK